MRGGERAVLLRCLLVAVHDLLAVRSHGRVLWCGGAGLVRLRHVLVVRREMIRLGRKLVELVGDRLMLRRLLRGPAGPSAGVSAAQGTRGGTRPSTGYRSGVTSPMLVKFGENDIKTVEDLAGAATDDLIGWTERKDGETTRYPGILDGFELSREEAEAIIMQARVKAGWISEADLASQSTEGETEEAAEAQS